jgi:hypothetical protein
LIAFNQVYRRIGIWKVDQFSITNPNRALSLPLVKGHPMSERARPIIRILLSLIGVLLICAPLSFFVWPVFALYGYAPLIFSTSPSLSNSELLGKISAVELECHKTWIWGYYATDAPWADVMTFYRTYGYQLAAPNNDYVSRHEPHLVRQVNLFDRQSVVYVHDEPLRTNLAAAFSKGRTVYSFSLVYTEHEESFQTRNCPGD